MTTYYRYEDVQYAPPADEDGERRGQGELHVHLRKYNVLRHTPKGVWIDAHGSGKFVLETAKKRFAWPTKEEAKASFIARKRRQIAIHQARIDRANQALNTILEKALYAHNLDS